ncbi:hypothetical protein EWM64_g5690 [Hericium alpestre]|uniref:Enoyl reductase (ER) domain-containing protein n=1 Tax=Hericium alpestre TaxID=135208 RepID=A0A4Y9ZXU2_9AGAM|nr:hypothetical protein EWM64_g5690 [Hericium alpestre]
MSAHISARKTQKAVIVQKDKTVAVETVPVPKPGAGEVLVKVSAAAQNPTDWKGIEMGRTTPGKGVGYDFAGLVAAVGDGVSNVKVGERVAGFYPGAFREYTLIPASLPLVRIPEGTSDEEASTIPLALGTAAIGLRRIANFPEQAPLGHTILVWGGSSSVGLYAIQLARLVGFKVITTASPKNHALVKSHGAHFAFDYRAPDVVSQIVEASGRGGVDYVYDAISEQGSYEASVKAFRKDGPRQIGLVLGVNESAFEPGVDAHLIAVATLLGTPATLFGRYFVDDERDSLFGQKLFQQVEVWLREERLKANPHTVIAGGLNGVQEGLKIMKEGKVSASKLVYRIADTPGLEA